MGTGVYTGTLNCCQVLLITIHTCTQQILGWIFIDKKSFVTCARAPLSTITPSVVNHMIVVFVHLSSAPRQTKIRVFSSALIINSPVINERENAWLAVGLNGSTNIYQQYSFKTKSFLNIL